MTAAEIERWRLVRGIFDEAGEDTQPDSVIARRCAGDSDLAEAVRRLLNLKAAPLLALDTPPVAAQPRPDAELLAGRFRLVRYLASGGMGEVWEATDQETGGTVALKFLLPTLLGEPRAAARFAREVDLARKIDHPNICRIHGLFEHNGERFCAMEFLEGETLEARLVDGPLAVEETLAVASQICDGLEAAHRAGVVHRDLKPGNIFLCPGGVKIIDFGLATAVARQPTLTLSGAVMGTLAYMAPEQLEGGSGSPASDIYALGVVLHEMLTGATPHRASSPFRLAALKARAASSSPDMVRLPAVWREALTRCLQPAPGKRYASAATLKDTLHRRRPTLGFLLTRPAVAAPAAAMLAVAVLSGSWVWWRSDDQPQAAAAPLMEQARAALTGNSPVRAAMLLEKAVAADPGYIPTRALLATAYSELDQPDRAREALLEATTRADQRWRRGFRDRLLLDAARAAVTRDFAAAATGYRALADASSGPTRTLALLDAARMIENEPGKLEEARKTLEQAIAEDPANPGARVRLGLLLVRLRDYDGALGAYAAAEATYRRTGNREGLGELLLARSQMPGRPPGQDRADLEQVLALSSGGGNRYQALTARFRLATVAIRSRDYEGGGRIARQAADEALREGMPVLAARAMGEFGYSFVYLRRIDEAVSLLEQSIEIAQRARASATLASSRMRLGEVLGGLRRMDEAVAVMEPAIDWYRRNPFPEQMPLFLIKWATLLNAAARWGEAGQALEQALELAKANGNLLYQAMALQRLASLISSADFRGALDYWERTVALAPQTRLTGSFYQAARAATAIGDFARAGQFIADGDRETATHPPGLDRANLEVFSAEVRALAGYRRGVCVPLKKASDPYLNLCGASALASRKVAAQLETALEKASAGDPLHRAQLASRAAEAAFRANDPARAKRLAARGMEASTLPNLRELALQSALVLRAAEAALGNHEAAARLTPVCLEHAAKLGFKVPAEFGGRADLGWLWARGSTPGR